MIRSKFVVIASVLMLLFVTSCNQDEADQAVDPAPVAVKKKPKAAATGATPGAAATPGKTVATAPASAGKANNTKQKAATANAGKAGAAGGAEVKQTLVKLNGYLPAAVKALQTDDVDTAKQYVKGFSDNWQQNKIIQSTVKKNAQASFNKISSGLTQVNNLMKAATPDKAKAAAAIQSLSQSVMEYAKG